MLTEGNQKDTIFCFKYEGSEAKPKNDSSLYPYYLMYMTTDGDIYLGNASAKESLMESLILVDIIMN